MGTAFGARVLELQTFLFEASLDGFGVAVVVLAVLNRNHVMTVLLG